MEQKFIFYSLCVRVCDCVREKENRLQIGRHKWKVNLYPNGIQRFIKQVMLT